MLTIDNGNNYPMRDLKDRSNKGLWGNRNTEAIVALQLAPSKPTLM